jgi:hypothetical protein
VLPSGSVDFTTQHSGFDYDRSFGHVHRLEAAEPTQIDNDAVSDGAPGHAAARTAWNERHRVFARPSNERADIGLVAGHRHGTRHDTGDAGGFRVDGARGLVGTEGAAISWR